MGAGSPRRLAAAGLVALFASTADGFGRSPALGRYRTSPSRVGASRLSASDADRAAAVQAAPVARDLTGDAGVLKTVLAVGDRPPPRRSATVEVAYTTRLSATGEVVDQSDALQFTLGQGDVITGWEVAVGAMQVGERARITCSPAYAYGDVGLKPSIPPGATIEFELTLKALVDASAAKPAAPVATAVAAASAASPAADAATGSFSGSSSIPQRQSYADLARPDIARTPAEIAAQYEARLAERKAATPAGSAQEEGLVSAILERFRTAYIFGLFDSQTGEKAPWYLNPLITFPGMFSFVGFGLVLVKLTGAVKLGVPGEIEVPLF